MLPISSESFHKNSPDLALMATNEEKLNPNTDTIAQLQNRIFPSQVNGLFGSHIDIKKRSFSPIFCELLEKYDLAREISMLNFSCHFVISKNTDQLSKIKFEFKSTILEKALFFAHSFPETENNYNAKSDKISLLCTIAREQTSLLFKQKVLEKVIPLADSMQPRYNRCISFSQIIQLQIETDLDAALKTVYSELQQAYSDNNKKIINKHLYDIVKKQIPINLDAACITAQSMPESIDDQKIENINSLKNNALLEVFKARLKVNKKFLTIYDVENSPYLETYKKKYVKSNADSTEYLDRVFKAVALSQISFNLEEALNTANFLSTQGKDCDWIFHKIALAYASIDINKALMIARQIEYKEYCDWIFHKIALAYASIDINKALMIARQIEYKEYKVFILCHITTKEIAIDLKESILEEVLSLIKPSDNERFCYHGFYYLIGAWIYIDTKVAYEIAKSFAEDYAINSAKALLEVSRFDNQIHSKEKLIKEAIDLINKVWDKHKNGYIRIKGSFYDIWSYFYYIVKIWAPINREAALQLIDEIKNLEYKVLALYEVAKIQSPFDLELTQSIFEQILKAIDSEEEKDLKIQTFCKLIEYIKINHGDLALIDKVGWFVN